MIDRRADPRTEDRIVYDLLSTPRGADASEVVGRAIFVNGTTSVEAPEAIRVAVDELLERAFVDRVQADERPRGYRRSGRGLVDMLVPGMAEHFIARLRGLWLAYPDGSVVTARASTDPATRAVAVTDSDAASPVTDAAVRRESLGRAQLTTGRGPLVTAHAPETGVRPASALSVRGSGPVGRTDCGWLI
jgi:hypothetical protein